MITRNRLLLVFQVASLYVGAIVGAGFASGREILQFFAFHGGAGLWGVLVATALFAYLGVVVLYLTVKYKTGGYHDLLPLIMGKHLTRVIDIISLFMLAIGLGVMFAGSGAVFNEQLGISPRAGIASALVITLVVILGGLKRILAANLVLVPLKMLAIFFISVIAIAVHGSASATGRDIPKGFADGWFLSSILYVSYNIPIAVLSSLGKSIDMKTGTAGGLVGGLVLGLAAGLVVLAELIYYPEAAWYQIPLLYIANQVGFHFDYILGLLIWLAIITTAIANVHGICCRFAPQNSPGYKFIGVGICLVVLPLTKFDFAKLVQVFYPIFGYAGLVIFVCLAVYPVRQLLKKAGQT